MKKYLFIYKSELMSSLQYIFNILAGFIGYTIFIYIFLNLWEYIYSDPNELINGYSMSQMIWYVIITELLWGIVSGRMLCKKIINDVRGGNIAYNINKPYNYIGYCLSSQLGTSTIKAIMYSILAVILGFIFLGSFPKLNILSIIAVIITIILATVINILLVICVGLLSFKLEDSSPFYWLYSKMILVIGTIFPIEYFPVVLQPIIKLSPIYVLCYGPAKLFVDFSWTNFIVIIIAQVIYIGIAWGLCTLLYKKGVKNLNVNGG